MKYLLHLLGMGWIASMAWAADLAPAAVTTGSLLGEMADLERLARFPEPAYRTIQFSSYDRRSTTSEAPGWFSNADGFGNEPIPNFLRVLREPKDGKPGLYLVAQVTGPGAIVRGWSAGMAGVLRVCLDPEGATPPIWEGPGYDFLARRSAKYFAQARLDLKPENAFAQTDADYLPIPFAKGLRVTWEGKLDELHFYQLQVRLYPAGTVVQTFDPQTDLKTYEQPLKTAIADLLAPAVGAESASTAWAAPIEPGKRWEWTATNPAPGAVRELKLRLRSDALDEALRGCLLRIAFDGSQRPQVEAPVGDFFGSGPGINPFGSLPMTVSPDGTCGCRFVMPFEQSIRVEIVNYTKTTVQLEGGIRIGPWRWNERSLYFRAKWRADHDLLAGNGALDLPFTVTIGKGVFVGCAAMVMNPTGVPTAGGNWWGEGDEKFLVDGETRPSTFGTGSEDYFNYSWSRPDLFANPYAGQALDSGPDTAGFVSNHRFQVMDAIPFERSLAALMELWTHNRTPGLSYARIAYHYARPGAIDDHRGLMPSDLRITPLPKRDPQALGGAAGARFYAFDTLRPEAEGGQVTTRLCPVATRLEVVHWQAAKGDQLRWRLPAGPAGRVAVRLVAVHQPGGATVSLRADGRALPLASGADAIRLQADFAPRVLNVPFQPVQVGTNGVEFTLECLEAGSVGLDYLWVKDE